MRFTVRVTGWQPIALAAMIVATLACGTTTTLAPPEDAPPCTPEDAQPLATGSHPARQLAESDHHCYRMDLEAGVYLTATVTQEVGLDLVWDLYTPTGRWIARFDAVAEGIEPLHWLHSASGPLLVSLRELDGHPGDYRLSLEISPSPTDRDIERAQAAHDFAEADLRYGQTNEERWLEQMSQAVERLAATGDPATEAALIYRLADQLQDGYTEKLLPIAERLVQLQDQFGTGSRQAYSRLWAALEHRGQTVESQQRRKRWANQALEIANALSAPEMAALAYRQLGNLAQSGGEPGAAERYYRRAIEQFHLAEQPLDAAEMWVTLGRWRARISDADGARDAFDHAEALIQEPDSSGSESAHIEVRTQLAASQGDLARTKNEWDEASRHYSSALNLAERYNLVAQRASALDGLARSASRLGKIGEGEELFAQSITSWRKQGELGKADAVRMQRAYERYLRDELDSAQRDYLELCPDGRQRGSKDLLTWASCRFGLGRIARDRHDLQAALPRMRQALILIEGHRARADQLDQRQRLAALRQHYPEELIDVLLQLDSKPTAPTSRYREEAFAINERARARSLLDHLRTAAGTPLDDPELLRRAGPGELGYLLSLEQTQELAKQEGALILQYILGPRQSHLWAIGEGISEVHTLPSRRELEEALSKDWKVLFHSDSPGTETTTLRASRHASDLLLAPVAHLLHGQPLWIVAQTDLDGFPFAALQLPSSGNEPRPTAREPAAPTLLVQRHRILRPPSLSSIAWLVHWANQRQPTPGKTIALVANPAYAQDSSYALLAGTGEEARRIASLLPVEASLLLTGLDAEPTAIRRGALNDFRFLHFAAHADSAQRQERTSLVLSPLPTATGATESYLTSEQIAQLSLSADLVVLAGCATGLGEKLAGESLQGLPQAFFRAGVPRILVSLWPIEDKPTAYFMVRFYSALFQGASPAEALQITQIEFLHHPKWHAPTYWAGFALRGLP